MIMMKNGTQQNNLLEVDSWQEKDLTLKEVHSIKNLLSSLLLLLLLLLLCQGVLLKDVVWNSICFFLYL